MNIAFARTLEFLLFPPGNLLLFLLAAVLFYRKPKIAVSLLLLGILQTTAFSLPVVAEWLVGGLTKQYPPQAGLWRQQPLPEAIVVLGAYRLPDAVEYNGVMSSNIELERLQYAAFLHRQTGLPILMSGSGADHRYMEGVLTNTFQVPVRWWEGTSETTWENAEYTDRILAQAGIRSAWLVTQAWHMPRAMQAFRNRQVQYYPASATDGSCLYWRHRWMWWIPQANALARSQVALHEWLGLLAYQLRR